MIPNYQSILHGRFKGNVNGFMFLHIRNTAWTTPNEIYGELASWRPRCSWNPRRERSSTTLWQPSLRAVEELVNLKKKKKLAASRELVGDWRMGTAIGPRSRFTSQMSQPPIPSAQRFCVWKRHAALLYMSRLCCSPVSWVRWFGASVLALFASNGLQQAPWGVSDRLLANKPELDRPSSHFFE
jgi:hypothetical protein